ncbi:MAG: alpha/beta fold hydrolase [Phycisphaerae bacterium]|nr:alpha/beta fold hydrolase [Phycisphaerae bacterium]
MVPHEITLDLPGGYQGFARLWLPARPKAAALYLHGIQSHGVWFERSAGRLAEEGCAVLLPDRRGSGRNQVDRGDAASPRQLVDDLLVASAALSARTGLARIAVVAVSWGAKLALGLAGRIPDRVERLVLVAPGLFPQVDVSVATKLSVASSSVLRPKRLFDVPLDDPELFTATPEWIEFIEKDPLSIRKVTARFLLTSRRLDWLVRAYGRRPAPVPIRLFVAGRDRIIDNERTRRFVRELAVEDRSLIEYPQAHHTLEFEPDPETYFQDLVRAVLEPR